MSREKLQKVIEYEFGNHEILTTALMRKSLSAETNGIENYNERMEFLEDSILSAVVAETLYLRYSCESYKENWRSLKPKLLRLVIWAVVIYSGRWF